MRRRLRSAQRDHQHIALALFNMGCTHLEADNPRDADPFLMESLDMRRRVFSEQSTTDHPDIADSLMWISKLRAAQGRHVEAVTSATESLAMHRRLHCTRKGQHPRIAEALRALAALLPPSEAEPLLTEAQAIFVATVLPSHLDRVACSLELEECKKKLEGGMAPDPRGGHSL
jgi:hypothetical protein